MRTITEPLEDRALTGRRMYTLAAMSNDLAAATVMRGGRPVKLSDLPLSEMHDITRRIPYRRDTSPIEVIARPKILLSHASKGLDCKKKAILLGAWFNANGQEPLRDWRFVAVSNKPSGAIHHVYPQVKRGRRWENADATYRHMKLYAPKKVTAFEVLEP